VLVPKLSGPREVGRVRNALAGVGADDGIVVGGLETARGVINAAPICAAGLDYVYFGAEDFVADLGGRRTLGNAEVQTARSQVVMAAAAAGIGAIDQVVVDIADLDRVEREAREARDLGYVGKLCIHPDQVPVVNQSFLPSDDDVAWAAGVIEAAGHAAVEGAGVATFDGVMVDAPLVARARRILDQA
jgi:citrate lyase subunit beta/citryl-CoA lyase